MMQQIANFIVNHDPMMVLQAERDMERAKAEKRLAELSRQNKKEESA